MKKAIISLSGGLDSTCLLMYLLSKGYRVKAYSFYYGQKHAIELKKVKKNIKLLERKGLLVEWKQIDLSDCFDESTSSLHIGGEEIPEGHYAEENMKSTVVENRNVIFAAILYGKALSWAKREGEHVEIHLGIHNGDHCFTEDTQVLTVDGYKTVHELKIGDKVYSFNGVNTEIDSVVDIIEKGTNSTIYNIKTTSGYIRLTGKHKVYCIEWGDFSSFGYTKTYSSKLVEEIKEGDILLTSYNAPDASEKVVDEKIDIAPIVEDFVTKNFHDKKVEITDEKVYIKTSPGRGGRMMENSRFVDAKGLLELIAWYITEGWTSESWKRNSNLSRFCSAFSQSLYKNMENCESIEEALKLTGFCVSRQYNKHKIVNNYPAEITYTFNSIPSVLMQTCGFKSTNKQIPQWIKDFLLKNPGYIKEFIYTLCVGDGHYEKFSGMFSYITKSSQLARDISFLIKKTGTYVATSTNKKGVITLFFGCLNKKLGLVKYNDVAMTKVLSIEVEKKREKVYDLSIEKNHNFFAGEYGNILISNSIYPDTTVESREACERAFRTSNWGSDMVSYEAPFIDIDKGQVLSKGINAMWNLNFRASEIKKVLSNTHTCYNPDSEGRSCGKCGSCTERLEAFEKNNMKDPIEYQDHE